VARGGIEPLTRGFSVQVPKRVKCLTAMRNLLGSVQYFPEIPADKPLKCRDMPS
jgi:hypothetical protein